MQVAAVLEGEEVGMEGGMTVQYQEESQYIDIIHLLIGKTEEGNARRPEI
jgi:hypothetical protein